MSASELNWLASLSGGDLGPFKRYIVHLNGDVNRKTTAYECSFLHWACDTRSEEATQYLIELNANLDAQDIKDETPMHIAASNSFLTGLTMLINAGASLDLKNSDGNTPLGVACWVSFTEGVELLLMSGASVDVEINMRHRKMKPEIAELLQSFNGGKAVKAAK